MTLGLNKGLRFPFHMQMKAMQHAVIALVAGTLVSCTAYQQQAGLIGGLAGATAGAVFGDDHQDVIAGAAAGAAVGAGAAAVHENHQRQRDYERYGIPPQDDSRQTNPSGPQGGTSSQSDSDYPVAQRTSNPDEVLSPYPPHHRINVAGFQSGQLARDPKNQKIFRIP